MLPTGMPSRALIRRTERAGKLSDEQAISRWQSRGQIRSALVRASAVAASTSARRCRPCSVRDGSVASGYPQHWLPGRAGAPGRILSGGGASQREARRIAEGASGTRCSRDAWPKSRASGVGQTVPAAASTRWRGVPLDQLVNSLAVAFLARVTKSVDS